MLDPAMFNAGAGPTGEMGAEGLEELRKALVAGYGTDMATLTGGGALRIQSLDTVMQATIQENQHFKLFNKLPKPAAGATVDEWTEMSSVGGFLGGSTNGEVSPISQATGTYNRRVGMVKYLMTQRQVSFVQTLQRAIADSEALEYMNGAYQLLTDAEYLCFSGDSGVVPTEFDGIYAQMVQGVNAGQVDAANIVDCQGQSLSGVGLLNQASAQVAKYGNWGRPTDIFTSLNTQADFDTGLAPAYRVPLANVPNGGIMEGAPVAGIRTSNGDIATNPDTFVLDEPNMLPFEVTNAAVAAANNYAPASVVPGTPATDALSGFQASMAGNYYYYVTGITASGQSVGVKSTQVAITAGQSVALTITRSASAAETGYVIYRSRLNGGNATSGLPYVNSDFRQMIRIPVSGSATTVYTDRNLDMPGTTKAYVLNLTPGATAITWRQLLPMVKFPLYPTNSAVIPWAQLLFGYLRISKRRHHVVLKNIVTTGQIWRPFN